MQKQSRIPIYIAAAILSILTALGSVFDFEIAKAVYIGQLPSDNIFGIIFSYIGIIPTFVGWSFLGAIIFYLSRSNIACTAKRRALIALSAVLFLLSFFYFCNTLYMSNANAFEVNVILAYSVGIAFICAAWYLGYKLSKKR